MTRIYAFLFAAFVATWCAACGHTPTDPTQDTQIIVPRVGTTSGVCEGAPPPTVNFDDVNMAGPQLLLSITSHAPYMIELTRSVGTVTEPVATVGPLTTALASIDVYFDNTYQYRLRYATSSCWSSWFERYVRPRNPCGSCTDVPTPAPPVPVTPPDHDHDTCTNKFHCA